MRRRVGGGFAVLCLLAGSGWAFEEAAPGLLTGLLRLAVHQGVLAVVFGLASLRRHEALAPRVWGRIAVGGVAIFVLPEVVFAAAGGHVTDLTDVLVFLLVPVVVIFVVAQKSVGFGADRNPMGMMVPALAALGGAALVIPYTMPESAVGKMWLAALVVSAVVAGVAAVWLHDVLAGVGVLRAAALVCAGSSVAAALFCRVGWMPLQDWSWGVAAAELARVGLLDVPVMLLTVWLLREMKPVSFSVRLLLIPLVTIVESIFVARPTLTWMIGAGVLLLAGGAAVLLRADSSQMP